MNQKYTNFQLISLVTLRVLIGWHLLYEGLAKLTNPFWSATNYLQQSNWSIFNSLSANSGLLSIIDIMTIWGLILAGFLLIAGLFTRSATIAAAVLLFLFYIAHPPLIGWESNLPTEGNYLIINKTIIEVVALFVLYVFPSGRFFGLDLFLSGLTTGKKEN